MVSDQFGDLVDMPAVRGRPVAPLLAVDGAEVTGFASAHSSQMPTFPCSCSQPTLVSPRRNHSSSTMIDRR